MTARASRIEDHAAIGDGRSAALVDRDGDVTWLAWPRFDSPATLAAILDPARGGHLRVGPAAPARAARAYVPGTNVLVTSFETGSGRLRLVDFMAIAGEDDLRRRAFPEHELVRLRSGSRRCPRCTRASPGRTRGRRPSGGSSPRPGFLGRNYGWSTAAVVVAAHVLLGAVLGLGAALAR